MHEKMRGVTLFLATLFLGLQGNCANGDILIQLEHRFDDRQFLLDSLYFTSKGDPITITTLKYYISGIKINYTNGKVVEEENSFHLIDLKNASSTSIILTNFPTDNVKSISFNLGIDSTTNVSGVFGGDLDPTKGMYWTWQSGYINFKLEGKSLACKSLDHEFQFHLGGYQYPFNTLEKVELKMVDSGDLLITLDLKKIIEFIDFGKLDRIMSPGNESIKLSTIVAQSFAIHTP